MRDYAGEKIAFYFQWQAFLNQWLLIGCFVSAFFFIGDMSRLSRAGRSELPGLEIG